MEPDSQLRNLRDFLMVYNRMTEICFQRCSSNFNYRNLTMDEERCVDSCAGKLIRSNHRLMGTYVQLMPGMVQRRVEEMENKAKEADKLAEAAAAAGALEGAAAGVPATPEGSPLAEATLISSPASSMTEAPPMTITGLSDVSPFLVPTSTGLAADIPVVSSPAPVLGEAMVASEVPVLKPAGLDLSAELSPAASVSIAALPPAPEGNLATATPLTPATAVIPSSLSQAVNELALTAVLPLELPPIIHETPTAGLATPISAPTMAGSSAPVTSLPPSFTPVTPRTPFEVTPAATVPAPTLSNVTQSPAAAVAPVVPPVAAPVVMPSPSQPEGVKPLSAPVLAPSVESLALPKAVSITAPTSNNDVSFTPSIPPSTVNKQDSQPPS